MEKEQFLNWFCEYYEKKFTDRMNKVMFLRILSKKPEVILRMVTEEIEGDIHGFQIETKNSDFNPEDLTLLSIEVLESLKNHFLVNIPE